MTKEGIVQKMKKIARRLCGLFGSGKNPIYQTPIGYIDLSCVWFVGKVGFEGNHAVFTIRIKGEGDLTMRLATDGDDDACVKEAEEERLTMVKAWEAYKN